MITNTYVGGAETVLYRLLRELNSSDLEFSVISLHEYGPVGEKIQALGIPVSALGMRSRLWEIPNVQRKLTSRILELKPNEVQTSMYHADLCGGLAS